MTTKGDEFSLIDMYRNRYLVEKALADELALALRTAVKYGRPPEQAAEVLAHYEAAKGR